MNCNAVFSRYANDANERIVIIKEIRKKNETRNKRTKERNYTLYGMKFAYLHVYIIAENCLQSFCTKRKHTQFDF